MKATFWDRVAHFYDAPLRQLNWAERQMDAAEGVSGRVLEACCGTGALALGLCRRGLDVCAVDLAPRMLAQAHARFARAGDASPRLARANVTRLPFPDAAFDYVIVTGALGLFPLAAKRAALRELARVCRCELRLLEPLEERSGFYWRRLLTLCVDAMRPIPRRVFAELGLAYCEEWRTLWNIFWVAEGARRKGAHVTVVHLADHHIEHCRGCEACARTGVCAVRDDHEAICQQLEGAQGLIVCSPVFGGSYSSLLKTFFDRLSCTLGFTGRFAHLCAVGVTTARYDFRAKTAREMAGAINASWNRPGYVTGYIHKQVMDTRKSRNIELSPENSPALYASALRMGEKLADDARRGRRGALPLPVRLLFRHFVLPGIAKILINEQDRVRFLYQTMQEQGIITDALLERHAAQMPRVAGRPWKTGEKIKFCR